MKFLVILAITLTLLPQLDLAYVFFSLFLIISLLLANKKLNKKYIIIGLIIGFIPLLPYLIHELLNKCPDCLLVFNINRKLAVARSLEVFARPLQIASQGNFRYVFGDDISIFANTFPLVYKLKAIFYMEYILIPLGLLLFWKKYSKFRFLIYAIIATPISYFAFRILPSMHYFAILIPFMFMFLGFSLYKLLSVNGLFKYLSYVLLFSIVAISIFYNFSFFSLIKSKGGLNGDYGATLGSTYPKAKDKFSSYKNDKNFREILISSYMPTSVMHSPSSFAQMLYPYEDIKNNLKDLETKLQQFPDNPIINHKLISYYTANPTKSTIDILIKKVKDIPEYQPIYTETLNLYLQTNYKKLYEGGMLDFSFEYPQHWKIIEDYENDSVKIFGEYFTFIINKKPELFLPEIIDSESKISYQTLLGKELKVIDYFVNNKYCKTSYSSFKLGQNMYQITCEVTQNNNLTVDLKDTKKIMDDIVSSFRIR